MTPTPRRSTFGRTSDVGLATSSIPAPSTGKRDSMGPTRLPNPAGGRRISSSFGDLRPPSRAGDGGSILEDDAETY